MNTTLTADPACDQCRLRKIKCGRERPHCYACKQSGVRCEFSGRGRKTSQIKGLTTNLIQIEDRLNHIDRALGQLLGNVRLNACSSSERQPYASPSDSEASEYITDNPVEAAVRFEGCLTTVEPILPGYQVPIKGVETYFPGTSNVSLLLYTIQSQEHASHNPQQALEGSWAGDVLSRGSTQISSLLNTAFRCIERCEVNEVDMTNDGLPTSLPPRKVLESVMDSFFAEVHLLSPIFGRGHLERMISTVYTGGMVGSSPAWIAIFNNIILLTLVPNAIRSYGGAIQQRPDASLIQSLVENNRRAFRHLSDFSQSSMSNLQAVMTMILVAQQDDEIELSSLLLSHACHLARAMGLHRHKSTTNEIWVEEERAYALLTLQTLDSNSCLMLEKSRHAVLEDCRASTLFTNIATPATKALIVRADAARLLDRIRRQLCDASRSNGEPAKMQAKVDKAQQCLQNLARQIREFEAGYSSCVDDDTGRFLQYELDFAVRTCRLMLRRLSHGASQFQESDLLDAAQCCRILLELQDNRDRSVAHVAVIRILVTYPLVCVFDLLAVVLRDSRRRPATSRTYSETFDFEGAISANPISYNHAVAILRSTVKCLGMLGGQGLASMQASSVLSVTCTAISAVLDTCVGGTPARLAGPFEDMPADTETHGFDLVDTSPQQQHYQQRRHDHQHQDSCVDSSPNIGMLDLWASNSTTAAQSFHPNFAYDSMEGGPLIHEEDQSIGIIQPQPSPWSPSASEMGKYAWLGVSNATASAESLDLFLASLS